ncbi:hypothetical protein CFC21_039678 [Triticum aestivum]|uniref:M-phase phosphoprotein 6 n=3 Tax=Triticum TaxID=4564 RepID=A0A9R1Q7J6_TRITD|nr:uncharacterized protein LOC119274701 [Triticum dicoccoides]XP_044347103.1 uncharacterized protein LOC123068564 [Triticum aestivum]KAF7027651.1 hypothetical protein CFC21_039678 [Triticum aestivum]VAH72229.1 unnamed protein product [Triticum turgidum subsp. durum]
MSAKKGLSSTLRNLKFMQRAAVAQKIEDKADVEVEEAAAEVVMTPAANGGGVGSSVQVARKCVVVMEGNPLPGAVKGRMSFQNFNPSIDKLNDEASGRPTQSASPSNSQQDSANTSRVDDISASRFRSFNVDSSESISLNELKRKEPELEMETPPSRKLPKTAGQSVDGQPSSQSNGRGSGKSNKHEKLDFNLLRKRKSK